MLLYQLYAEITTFFDEEMLGSVSIQDVDVKTFGEKLTSKLQNRHPDVMHESRVRRHF